MIKLVALTLMLSSALTWLGEETFVHAHFSSEKNQYVSASMSQDMSAETSIEEARSAIEVDSENESIVDAKHFFISKDVQTISLRPEIPTFFLIFKSISRPPERA